MKLLPMRLLEPDSVLSVNIRMHDGRILLPANSKITEQHIKRLTAFGIFSVYIEDDFSKDVNFIPALTDSTKTFALKTIQNAFENTDNSINLSEIDITYKKIYDELISKKEQPLNLYNFYLIDNPHVLHGLNVAVITAAISISLDLNPSAIKDYVIAAILHDIKLKDQKQKEEPSHVQEGYAFLKKINGIKSETCVAVKMHHEYFGGLGWPDKIAGDKINIGARIIAVADMYDKLVHGLGCKRIRHHLAAENINSMADKFFDPQIVNIFNKIVSIYPLGSVVYLNNDKKALIIKHNRNVPSRPVVRLIYPDKDKKQEINLLEEESLFITAVE